MPQVSRNPRIDVLRGISIAVVLLLHFSLAYHLVDSPIALVIPAHLLHAVVRNGNYGVTIFFVISGFLITSMSIKRFRGLGGMRLRVFYKLRFARIMPCLLLALSIIVFLGSMGLRHFRNLGPNAPSNYAVVVLSVLTFWHNVQMAFHGYFNYSVNIFWSLSVEEVFYMGFPLMCMLLKRQRWIGALCILAMVVGPLYRQHYVADDIHFMYGYLACFDAIAMGCLAAMLNRRFLLSDRPADWKSRLGQIFSVLLIGVTYLRGITNHEVFSFTWVALGTSVLLVSPGTAAPGWLSARPSLAWLRWLGKHSFELYLFHIILLGLMIEIVPSKTLSYGLKPVWLGLFIGLSAVAAWLVARYWSEPLNRWIRVKGVGWTPTAGTNHHP